jgi:hypothetical protein
MLATRDIMSCHASDYDKPDCLLNGVTSNGLDYAQSCEATSSKGSI